MAYAETYLGSTAVILHVEPGIVLKHPHDRATQELNDESAVKFDIERQIFELLGEHPRIVRYLGWQDATPDQQPGFLLAEASPGNLGVYLYKNHDAIPLSLRKKWCRQAIESIVYLHQKGVIHCDIRPDNMLIYTTTSTTPPSLDLCLCDFGGSECEKLGLSNPNLPDAGFYNPNSGTEKSRNTDIFAMGSVLYTILTGHWPYREPAAGFFESLAAMDAYMNMVDGFFEKREFPDVTGIWAGDVIRKCWMEEYASAEDALQHINEFFNGDTTYEHVCYID
ncbi:kinase-like protein [Hypoxylon trugodes]|uniref:kinase-like protein n=1 Tax=Hypoxylon trugodes TaxID=326681 RepID=UPI00219FDB82|nr:kinase-like protein [Hypoxylon trugodes]KAI1387560.1 kinase-like protein [Hypoxylon trugodes]